MGGIPVIHRATRPDSGPWGRGCSAGAYTATHPGVPKGDDRQNNETDDSGYTRVTTADCRWAWGTTGKASGCGAPQKRLTSSRLL